MALNNAYNMYTAIMELHSTGRHLSDMGNAVRELTHELCQRGPAMRQMRVEHPSWTRDMTRLFGWFPSRKIRLDKYGFISQRVRVALPEVMAERPASYALWKHEMKRKRPLCSHQSEVVVKQGRCCWDDCPGYMTMNTKRHMRCEECSIKMGKDDHLCNIYLKGMPVNCHRPYYIYHHNKQNAMTMVLN